MRIIAYLLLALSVSTNAAVYEATATKSVLPERVTQFMFERLIEEATYKAISKSEIRGYLNAVQTINGIEKTHLKELLPTTANVAVLDKKAESCAKGRLRCLSVTVNVDLDKRAFIEQLQLLQQDEGLRNQLAYFYAEDNHPIKRKVNYLRQQVANLKRVAPRSDSLTQLQEALRRNELVFKDIQAMRLVNAVAEHYSNMMLFNEAQSIERVSVDSVKIKMHLKGFSLGQESVEHRIKGVLNAIGYDAITYYRVVHQGNVRSQVALGNDYEDGHQLRVRQYCVAPKNDTDLSPVLLSLLEGGTHAEIPFITGTRHIRVGDFKVDSKASTRTDAESKFCVWDRFEYNYEIVLTDQQIYQFKQIPKSQSQPRLTLDFNPVKYALMSVKDWEVVASNELGLLSWNARNIPEKKGANLPVFRNDPTTYGQNLIIGCDVTTGNCTKETDQWF